MPSLKSPNYYDSIFGADFGTKLTPASIECAHHKGCNLLALQREQRLNLETNMTMRTTTGQETTTQSFYNKTSKSGEQALIRPFNIVKLLKNLNQRRDNEKQIFYNVKDPNSQQHSPSGIDAILQKHPVNKADIKTTIRKKENPVDRWTSDKKQDIRDASQLNFMDKINKLSETHSDKKADLKAFGMPHESNSNATFRKSLSESGKYSSHQFEVQDYEEMKQMKKQKKQSEDNNTLRKSIPFDDSYKSEENPEVPLSDKKMVVEERRNTEQQQQPPLQQ